MTPAELLLHPVRLRIVQAFLGGRRLTTGDLRRLLDDVPTATLYRQVTTLLEGGALEVVDEHKVRGAVERTYELRTTDLHVDAEAAGTMSPDEHRQAFFTFTASLLGDFERYLSRDDVDLARDMVGYGQVGLHLDDEEMTAFLADLQAVVLPRLAHEPRPGRTRRVLTTVVVPADD